MSAVFTPNAGAYSFFREMKASDYAMREQFIRPELCTSVLDELRDAGQLYDLNERQPTSYFRSLPACRLLHRRLQSRAFRYSNEDSWNGLLGLFSVRVFKQGVEATTIHRNDSAVGPWVVGITLQGEAPFNVYQQNQLLRTYGATIPLRGDGTDPTPLDSMQTSVGSAWGMYTAQRQIPHSGGLVSQGQDRVLLLLYDLTF